MWEQTGISTKPPLLSLLLILVVVVLGFALVGPAIGFFLAIPFYDGNMLDLPTKIGNPLLYPEIKTALFILQGSATGFGLIMIPALYLRVIEQRSALGEIKSKPVSAITAVVTALLVLAFMAPNSVFIEWNNTFSFPEFLKTFEQWAREREDLAAQFTKFMTKFESIGEFFIGVFVIALLPAIGEELVFRGMIQPELYRAGRNQHVAIWVTAILFSAFHMQFFGFVPRMLLGALFGYLYVWSGSLFVPMIAHFVNNGFAVIMVYLNQLGIVSIDIDSPEAAPWPTVAVLSAIFAGLVYYFKKINAQKHLV